MRITRKHIGVIVGASIISLGLVGGTSFAANAATASISANTQKPALHGTETPKRTPVPVPTHDAGDDHGHDGVHHATPEPGDDNGRDTTDHHGGRVGPDDNNHNRGGSGRDDSGHDGGSHGGGGHDDGPGHH